MNLKKYYKLANNINIILNIIVCLAVYFIFHGNLIAIIISFLIMIWLYENLNGFLNKKFSRFIIKNSKIDLENTYVQNIQRPYNEKEMDIWSSLIKEINEQKDKLNELKAKEEKQKKEEVELIQRMEYKDLEKFKILFDEYTSYFENYKKEDVFYVQLKNINQILIEIKTSLEENPDSAKLIPITIYTYMREFIILISDYPNLNNETKEKMEAYYLEMMNQFIEFLSNVRKKIVEIPDKDTHINLIALMQDLEEENKKES